MTRQCEACDFWIKNESRKERRVEEGVCHRHPLPQPVMRADAWCGEFAQRAREDDPKPGEVVFTTPKPKPAKASRSRKSGASK